MKKRPFQFELDWPLCKEFYMIVKPDDHGRARLPREATGLMILIDSGMESALWGSLATPQLQTMTGSSLSPMLSCNVRSLVGPSEMR
jgi:hypothetical protein